MTDPATGRLSGRDNVRKAYLPYHPCQYPGYRKRHVGKLFRNGRGSPSRLAPSSRVAPLAIGRWLPNGQPKKRLCCCQSALQIAIQHRHGYRRGLYQARPSISASAVASFSPATSCVVMTSATSSVPPLLQKRFNRNSCVCRIEVISARTPGRSSTIRRT